MHEMWDFVKKLLWLPVDIMQRVSQRMLLLGRNVFASLYGSKPAIKPPPSPPLPKVSPRVSLSPQPGLDLETKMNVVDIEQGSAIIVTSTEEQLVMDNPDVLGEVVSEATCMSQSAATIYATSAEAMSVPCATNIPLCETEVINERDSHGASTASSAEKRFPTKEKRTKERKSSKAAVVASSGCNDESVKEAATNRRQFKKQRLSEEAKEESESCQDTLDHDKPKRKKRRAKKKNKKDSSNQEDESAGDMGAFTRPNFFIAVQISDREILSKVAQLQKVLTERAISPPWHGLERTEIFKDAMVPVEKLHFTLHVMHLRGPEDQERAQNVLHECWKEVYQEFMDNPLDLTIEGLGHFKNSVLFAQIKNEEQVQRMVKLADLFRKKFDDLSISGDPRPFKPHMTIAKISRSNKLHKMKIRSFPPEIWNGCEDTNFGSQRVFSLQLLRMAGEDKLTGYYQCLRQHYFNDRLTVTPSSPYIFEAAKKVDDDPAINQSKNFDSDSKSNL